MTRALYAASTLTRNRLSMNPTPVIKAAAKTPSQAPGRDRTGQAGKLYLSHVSLSPPPPRFTQFAPLSGLPPEMGTFFAAGVLFAAAYATTGASRELIRLAFQSQVGLVMNPDVLEETLGA